MKINFKAPSRFELFLEPPSKSTRPEKYFLRRDQFAIPIESDETSKKLKIPDSPYLIIGFDTEFESTRPNFTNRQIRNSSKKPETQIDPDTGEPHVLVKNKILSYQFLALFCDEVNSPISWEGIACPAKEDDLEARLSLGTFISFVIAEGMRQRRMTQCPLKIYLVGHFTRADVPAFADFQDMTHFISNVRNTFISTDSSLPIQIKFDDKNSQDSTVTLSIILRDTMLLTPATSKSLSAIGDLMGVPKIKLDDDPKKDQAYKEKMSRLRREKWELFKEYALTDARICAVYAKKIMEESHGLTGKLRVPSTLSSIGVDLLIDHWKQNPSTEPLRVLGKKIINQKVYNKRLGYFTKRKREVPLDIVSYHIPLAIDCYHGGRNEQFWFGPGYQADWFDFDLASAYPTAMSLLALPDWERVKFTTNLDDFDDFSFSFVRAKFSFPDTVRYPTLPVRTDNGLIFPLSGETSFCGPELSLARNLGAKIEILHGIVFPINSDVRPFGDFVKDCIARRRAFKKGDLKELFWKEITNSTYGKTAQGLQERYVFDIQEREMQRLPESPITNPFYAGMITSSVRAVLGEIMNAIPQDRMVFSCTTDGFLTDADQDEIVSAQNGSLCALFRGGRELIANDPKILEVKHRLRRPLGWRTRGQATLEPHTPLAGEPQSAVLLAKGGIRAPRSKDTAELQNTFITETFFGRHSLSKVEVEFFSSTRDNVIYKVDLVGKHLWKKLNMEYDWKRQPFAMGFSNEYRHIAFSTRPWNSKEEFETVRELWQSFVHNNFFCMKRQKNFYNFYQFVISQTSLPPSAKKYLHKEQGDLQRLRQSLCRARYHRTAGFEGIKITAAKFAEILVACGVPCNKTDVENARGNTKFEPHYVPITPLVEHCFKRLVKIFPFLEVEKFLPDTATNALFLPYDHLINENADIFVSRLT